MRYVILTAAEDYGRHWGDEAERTALASIEQWALAVDRTDRLETPQLQRHQYLVDDPERGGPIQRVVIAPIRDDEQRKLYRAGAPAPSYAPESVAMERVLMGYRRAALLAGPRGRIGIALGHGVANDILAAVDLAPVELLRVDLRFLEGVDRLRGGADPGPDGMSAAQRAFSTIGEILREGTGGAPIERVDFYTCQLGASPLGQDLMDWLHHLWGVRVQGLRGLLSYDLFTGRDATQQITAWVVPPPGPLAEGHAFNRRFPGLIDEPSLWVISQNRRPAASP